MSYSVKVLADSCSPAGDRLTTLEVTLPRIVLAEFNTHRMFSRNSASSRAIPVAKMIARVLTDPFVPIYWGKNQKGMQADQELTPEEQAFANEDWLHARDRAVEAVRNLVSLGVHKQIANRLLEPFLWHTIVVSATDWTNFFALRRGKDAQPEIRHAANLMADARFDSTPRRCSAGEWHLPFVTEEDTLGWSIQDRCKISVGRCARVSYLTHAGIRAPTEDIALADSLQVNGHMSPFEHVATPMSNEDGHYSGNFFGWVQLRKMLPNEDDFGARNP